MIDKLAMKLAQKYNKTPTDVLFDLIRVEEKYHNKQLKTGVPYRFDRCYFLIAAGYLNNKYRVEQK